MGILDAPSPALSKSGRERLLTQNAAALQKWRAALASRDFAPVNVVCLGDSITEGQGATTFERTYRQALLRRLRERFPVAGVTGGRGFIGAAKTGFSSGTWPVVTGGSPAIDQDRGPKRQAVILSAAGHSLTFTIKGTSVDLMYARATSSGTISYTIDGGAATTLALAGGTTALQSGQLARINLGTSGAHTLVVSYSSGGSCYIEGVVEYDGDETKGIRVHDAGHHGWTTATWSNRGGFDYWMHSIRALNPDLLVLALMANDSTIPIAPATSLSNLKSILSILRGDAVNPSVLVVPMFQRSEVTATTWLGYVQAAYQLMAEDPLVSICDLSARMPAAGLGSNSLGLYADTVHPTDKGHSMIADAILESIAP